MKINRQPDFENEMCKSVGLYMTCNACDRIIFKDEKFRKQYKKNGGYCSECETETKQNPIIYENKKEM